MNLLKKKKDLTIGEKLSKLPLDVEVPGDYGSKNTIRTIISRDMKDNYPEMAFTTRIERDKKKFYIKRIA